ncbi:copper resistance protein CopC [Streptomyces sp. NBC_01142]|uniref:copper resistance protein CopC n=1 Tax=Streptomyces sp. NBC_01142 TaxID=2975865 RepID=UPI0022593184|nr:copper resistance protein CopC [Streptomyces sp. NBC_01142]MCX4824288.1 copper resistance protein CopC [Streptomyces sp. NBC_01142]
MTATAPRLGPSPARLLLAAAVLLGTLLGALLAGASPASAHAALTGSNPKDGAVVATAPKDVTLTFSEQIAMGDNSIRVLEPSGKRADKAKVRDLGTGGKVVYGVDLHAGLPTGTYTVAWQAVSADSHPVSGAFTFSIGAPSKTTVALPEQKAGGGVVGALYDIARYASYTGFILLTGGAAFVLACWRRGASVRSLQRLVVRGWLTLTAATLAMLLLRTPYTGSGSLADAFDLGGLSDVLETKTGAALVSRLLLLGAAALFVAVLFGTYAKREDETEKNDLTFGLTIGGTVVAAGIAATWALSEHASTGIQPGLAMPVDVLHLLAVAAWLGGLAALLTALYRAPSIERAAVRRFSGLAFGSVVVLTATGLYQSWRQVGSWSALTGTSYGQLLLLKVGLVAVMVAVAWISRRWTSQLGEVTADETEREPVTVPETTAEATEETEAAKAAGPSEAAAPGRAAQLARQKAAVATARKNKDREADPERSGLRRSVLAEAGVAVVLLAVTTVLTATEPGRTEEEAAKAGDGSQAAASVPEGPTKIKLPFDTGGQNGKGTVRLSLDPARSGANEMDIRLDSPDGKPLDAAEVKVAFTLKAKEIGPLPIVPDRLAKGHWSAPVVQIPMPGDWEVKVTVRTSDIDQTTIDKNVKIG